MKLNLWNNPNDTLYYFYMYIINFINYYIMYLINLSLIISTYSIITINIHFFDPVNAFIINAIYWFFLGIMSTIGLGFGIHTGLLILFPLVTKVAITSTYCGNTNFDIYHKDSFLCIEKTNTEIGTLSIIKKVWVEIFFWALGTSFGEIPPYLISKYARINKQTSFDFTSFTNNKFLRFINKITIDLLLKYKFWTILVLSSYPNVMFDLCGIASGHYLIPFNDFLLGTIIGKCLIKTPLQCFILIKLFTSNLIENTILKLPKFISKPSIEYIDLYKQKLENPQEIYSNDKITYLWNSITILLFLYFIKSCIEIIANKEKDIQKQRIVK